MENIVYFDVDKLVIPKMFILPRKRVSHVTNDKVTLFDENSHTYIGRRC